MENITRCICPLSGTFVVLLAKKNYNASVTKTSTRPILVVISCGCCFLQSCIAFAIMLPILYQRRCCVTFLKMQFCSATSMAMAIFILGLLQLFPQEWFNAIIALLTAFLLLSSSTLVAITVLVTTELGPRKLTAATGTLATGISGSIGLSWFLPILCATSTPLVYSVLFESPDRWWHTTDSFGFILFIVIESLFVILFLLLFLTLMKKLLYLAKKHDKHNTSILRRIGLLYRTAMLFVSNVLCHTFYLVYLNSENLLSGYLFSASSIILGFCILFSFVIRAEVKHDSESTSSKSSTKNSLDDNCCSGSINSPLSFYTTQDLDKDNECLPSGDKSTKIPLTILPSPHSQQLQQHQTQLTTHITTIEPCIHGDGHSIETYLGGSISTGTATVCNIVGHEYEASPTAAGATGLCNFNTKTRCYEMGGQQHHAPVALPMDNPSILTTSAVSASVSVGVIGQFDWHQQQQQPSIVGLVPCGGTSGSVLRDAFSLQNGTGSGLCYVAQQQQETNEFVGVGGLDILKGVGQDSIIGIRSKGLEISDSVTTGSSKLAVRDSSSDTHLSAASPSSSLCILQQSTGIGAATNQQQPVVSSVATPVITVTGTDDQDRIDGMLDRISHDLDYLLNRTSEVPTVVPIQLWPTTAGSASASNSISGSSNSVNVSANNNVTGTGNSKGSSCCAESLNDKHLTSSSVGSHVIKPPSPPACQQKLPLISTCHSVHEVIIEESEDVDS